MKIKGNRGWMLMAFLLASAVHAGAASAQDTPPEDVLSGEAEPGDSVAPAPATAPKPWNRGVSAEEREKAQPFFDAGNGYFERSNFGNALKEYRKAIAFRDHPAIRYNMAVCLINLGQPIAASENLEAAMRFGEEPLGAKAHQDAQTYRKLLHGQLAELRIITSEVGARVSLDGEPLFEGPGESTRLVMPRRHQVVATKAKMLTLTHDVVPIPGESNEVLLDMRPLSDGLVLTRRWSRWKPWAVVGAGAGVGLLGVPLLLAGNNSASSYDREVALLCPEGCAGGESDLPSDVRRLETRSNLQQGAAVAMFLTGGALLSSGAVLLWLNQPTPTQQITGEAKGSARRLQVSPVLEQGVAGAVARFGF